MPSRKERNRMRREEDRRKKLQELKDKIAEREDEIIEYNMYSEPPDFQHMLFGLGDNAERFGDALEYLWITHTLYLLELKQNPGAERMDKRFHKLQSMYGRAQFRVIAVIHELLGLDTSETRL